MGGRGAGKQFTLTQLEKIEKDKKAVEKFRKLLLETENHFKDNGAVLFHQKLRLLGYLECMCECGLVNTEDYIHYCSAINDIQPLHVDKFKAERFNDGGFDE